MTSSKPTTTNPIGKVTKPQLTTANQLDPGKLHDPTLAISELNRRYAVVKVGGKAQVVDEHDDQIDFMSFPDFQRLYSNIQLDLGKQKVQLGQYWLKHSGRRQYLDGIQFDPSLNTSSGKYNLWRGFAISPTHSNQCTLFLEHLEAVICGGNRTLYEYTLNWLALLAQEPSVLPQVALVLLSEQGTGKGLFMEYLGKIFGKHYKHLTDKSHLVGSFSGHLQDAILVFADELSWNDNKNETGILKGLITEPTRMMEKKFADALPIKNCTHLVIASNESWAVPAELTDRRFCVLQVSGSRKQDHAYFNSLVVEMNTDGPGSLLALLLKRDISNFNPGDFPKTSARASQQLQSLDPIEKWLVERLQFGSILKDDGTHKNRWPEKLPKEPVYDFFKDWCRKGGLKQPAPALATFTVTLKKYGITTCRMPEKNGSRPNGYKFPELDVIRETFEGAIGGEIDWGDACEAQKEPLS